MWPDERFPWLLCVGCYQIEAHNELENFIYHIIEQARAMENLPVSRWSSLFVGAAFLTPGLFRRRCGILHLALPCAVWAPHVAAVVVSFGFSFASFCVLVGLLNPGLQIETVAREAKEWLEAAPRTVEEIDGKTRELQGVLSGKR